MKQKKMLYLNGGESDIPLLLEAKRQGYYVILTGYDTSLAGYQYGDEIHTCDYSDKEAILALAKKCEIDVICSNCNDMGLLTASYVAEKMRLSGFDSYETSCKVHLKDLMKKEMQQLEMPCPISKWFENIDDAFEWAETAEEYPYIAKPVDMSAGRGMTVAYDRNALRNAIETAHKAARSGNFVVEPYIEGGHGSHSCFLVDGKIAAWYMTDEYVADAFGNPYVINGCCSPAEDMEKLEAELNKELEKFAAALKLKNGLIHTQYKYCKGKIYILEITRRHPGMFYSTCASLATGISWPEWYLRFQCGDTGESFPEFKGQSGIRGRYMIMCRQNGTVVDVSIDDELRPYVFDRQDFWKPEHEVKNCRAAMIGILFLEFPSWEEHMRIRSRLPELVKITYKEQ